MIRKTPYLFPPRVECGPELRWMLLRAFGPLEAAVPAGLDAAGAARMARLFGLEARIAFRLGDGRVGAELGPSAGAFVEAHRNVTVKAVRLLAATKRVAQVAARLETPVVLLKGMALLASKRTTPGLHPTADVDLLVPVNRAEALREALRTSGWLDLPTEAVEQHLRALTSPDGSHVEIHVVLLGVRRSSRSLTADELIAEGVVEEVPGFPGRVLVPTLHVLVAHSLVHGLVGHGGAEVGYPLLRTVGDVLDLTGGLGEKERKELVLRIVPLVRREMDERAVRAAFRLAGRLGKGDVQLFDELGAGRAGPDVALLRHILARSLSKRYVRRLPLLDLTHLSDRSRVRQIGTLARRAIWLTSGDVELFYGPNRQGWERTRIRLLRPFEVGGKLLRHFGLLPAK